MKEQQKGFTLWLTGLPSSGKSTLARLVAEELARRGHAMEVLDGDEVRKHLSKGLGFSRADRDENIRRIGFVCRLLSKHGVIAIAAAISPYRAARDEVRSSIARFFEIHVEASLETCMQRDIKGLYRKAAEGQLGNLTGVSDPYEPPLNPELVVNTESQTPAASASRIIAMLEQTGLVTPSLAPPRSAAEAAIPADWKGFNN